TENNQGCENSDEVQIQFIEPSSINFETSQEAICEGDVASFPFTVTGTNGPWSLAFETEGSSSTFDFSGSSSTLQLSPVETSQYNILSITDDFGCVSTLTNELNVQVDQMPEPFAGEDKDTCGLEIQLDATMSEFAQTGQWQAPDGTFANNETDEPKVVFTSNIWGEQTLTWTETNGLCTASDQVTISFDEPPVADAGDDFMLYHQYETTLRAREPVTSQGEWVGEWYIQPGGSGTIANPSQQETLVSGLKHGQTVVEWIVTNGACPTETDLLTITIKGLTYHTGMSPNNDGVNDFFKIKGAHTIANNELIVFDQNGQVVYRQRNLEEGNKWEGTDLDGSPLDNGIYYFIFEGEEIEPLKDYIVIKRN
ncbi:T9SS type B sorting domain-containing protein, partial [Marinilabilia sp.]